MGRNDFHSSSVDLRGQVFEEVPGLFHDFVIKLAPYRATLSKFLVKEAYKGVRDEFDDEAPFSVSTHSCTCSQQCLHNFCEMVGLSCPSCLGASQDGGVHCGKIHICNVSYPVPFVTREDGDLKTTVCLSDV